MGRTIEIDELKHILLDILKHIDSFCRDNKIKYFLSGGTAIGAIRHHGFIPWDDDIDIMMLREDYERFISLYKEMDHSEYTIHNCDLEHGFHVPFTKVDHSLTVLRENINTPGSMGVSIDVFPIDSLPDDVNEQHRIYRKAGFLTSLYNLKQVKYSPQRGFLKNCILAIGRICLAPISIERIVKRLAHLPDHFKYEDSKYCGVVIWGYGMREINLKENYADVLYVLFEGLSVPVPAGYDNYLKSVYGDYMQLPPEEKRVSHHAYIAYWK